MAYFYWDPDPEIFVLPFFEWPIRWYGALFALGFSLGFRIFVQILTRFLGKDQKNVAYKLTDRLTAYMVVATVIGARLGHFLFYEKPSQYFSDPLKIFCVWRGGPASHGAAIGIVIALILFSRRIRTT